jgi:hypothetical protein
VFRLDSSIGNVGIHLDYFTRENDNVKIDGFAIDEAAVERLEELTAAFIGDDQMIMMTTTMMIMAMSMMKKSSRTPTDSSVTPMVRLRVAPPVSHLLANRASSAFLTTP